MGKNKDQNDEDTIKKIQESHLIVNKSNYNDLVNKIDNLTEYFRHFEMKAMDAIHRPDSTNEQRCGGINLP